VGAAKRKTIELVRPHYFALIILPSFWKAIPKLAQNGQRNVVFDIAPSDFGFVSGFEFRASDLVCRKI
jgi:hypothetical protein